jgi:hypothetical protein
MSAVVEKSTDVIEKIDQMVIQLKELLGEVDLEFLSKSVLDTIVITMNDVYKMSSQLNVEKHLTIQKYKLSILEALGLKEGTMSQDQKEIIMSHDVIASFLKFNPKAFQNMQDDKVIELITKRFTKLSVEEKMSFIEIFEGNMLERVLFNFIKEKYQPKKQQAKKQWADVVGDEEKVPALPEIRVVSPAESVAEEYCEDEMPQRQAEKFEEIANSVRSLRRSLIFKRKDKSYNKESSHLLTSWSKLLSIVCEGSRYLLPSNKDSYSHENFEVWYLVESRDGPIVKRVIAPVHMRYVQELFGFWYTIDSHKNCHLHYFDENWEWCHKTILSNGNVKDITNEKLLELCAGSRK